MNKQQIGFLHPGAMGISLAVTAQNSGHTAHWVSHGRSAETRARAEKYGLVEMQSLEELCATCSLIISVCPPASASAVAQQVIDCSFNGIYVDANAISPQRTKQIGQSMSDAGIDYVDGSVIGGPAWEPQSTWLYLAGPAADQVAACFAAGPLETEIIGDEIGKASALKMCFSANSKGVTALLCAIVASAEAMGVREELETQWSRYDAEFTPQTRSRISRVAAKAWRYSGEMEEIAATFEATGLPGGFHLAAHDVYERIAKFKGADPLPPVEDVLDALLHPDE